MGRRYDVTGELTMQMMLHVDQRPKHTEHNKFDKFYFLQDTFLRDLFARLLPMQVRLANPLQMYTYFGQGYEAVKANYHAEAERIRKKLLAELNSQEIVDLMLFPAENEKGKFIKM